MIVSPAFHKDGSPTCPYPTGHCTCGDSDDFQVITALSNHRDDSRQAVLELLDAKVIDTDTADRVLLTLGLMPRVPRRRVKLAAVIEVEVAAVDEQTALGLALNMHNGTWAKGSRELTLDWTPLPG